MTPLPGYPGGSDLIGWRLDRRIHAATWDTGEGAFLGGGRWNSKGVRAVYCAVDPATAILEVAVHKGFKALDMVPHTLTSFKVTAPADDTHVVQPHEVPNPNWLVPGFPSAGQQEFGDGLLAAHKFVLIPSVVSRHSWNLIFVASVAAGGYSLLAQEAFGLDPRLNPVP